MTEDENEMTEERGTKIEAVDTKLFTTLCSWMFSIQLSHETALYLFICLYLSTYLFIFLGRFFFCYYRFSHPYTQTITTHAHTHTHIEGSKGSKETRQHR